MARRLVLWAVLLVVLAGTSWLAWLRPEPPIIRLDRDGRPVPDYYLNGLTLRRYTPAGELAQVLKAKRLSHVPALGTLLTEPRLTVESQEGAPWQLSAQNGELDPDGIWLTLPDAVTITRRASLHNRPLEMHTRALRYRMDQGYAETDEAVTVVSDATRVQAVGAQAWLQEERIHFKSQVRGHYVP